MNEEIFVKRNVQLGLKLKVVFYIASLLIPFSILFLFTNYDYWIKILPLILVLILDRTLLNLPFEFSQLSYGFIFNPVKSLKGVIQLFRPQEEELIAYPILKPIFYFSIILFAVYRFSLLLIIIGLLFVILKSFF